MDKIKYLIVGGGLTGGYAIKTLVANQATGQITLVSADSDLPYDRPPLSKGLLLDKENLESILVNPKNFYAQHRIQTFLNTSVVRLDLDRRCVITDKGEELFFEKLLLCTGASPRVLEVPQQLQEHTFYLRTLRDSLHLKERMKTAKRAHIIGASFIGMELASSFTQKGIQTTILDNGQWLFPKLAAIEISKFFEDYYTQKGVEIIHGWKDEFPYDTDLLAIGVGVKINTQFLENSGLEIDNGVVVDDSLETRFSGIYAGGDIANYYDPVFKKRRRVEHWDVATRHGEIAALNMMGKSTKYTGVSYYFSDLFDLSFDFVGDNSAMDETRLVGSTEAKKFIVLYLKEKKLVGYFALGIQQEDKDMLTERIEKHQEVVDFNFT